MPVTVGAEGVWREDEEGFKSTGHPSGGVHVALGERSGPEASAHGHEGPGGQVTYAGTRGPCSHAVLLLPPRPGQTLGPRPTGVDRAELHYNGLCSSFLRGKDSFLELRFAEQKSTLLLAPWFSSQEAYLERQLFSRWLCRLQLFPFILPPCLVKTFPKT